MKLQTEQAQAPGDWIVYGVGCYLAVTYQHAASGLYFRSHGQLEHSTCTASCNSAFSYMAASTIAGRQQCRC